MSDTRPRAPIAQWLSEPLPADVRRALERLAEADDVERIAVMPDVHLAEGVCIGTVVATRRLLYPEAVGGDAGCGMSALRLDCEAERLADASTAAQVLAGLRRAVPAIRHGQRSARERLLEPLAEKPLGHGSLEKLKTRDSRVEFATLGRGEAFRNIGKAELLRQMRGVWFDHRLADRLRDEAPSAYKDIGAVMRAQSELTRVVQRLRPILSYKGA
jgi:tRNA-splicing ligase RtcB